ncbi:MAG: rubrerythrin [Planctomycetaceae bacterium]|nr:rubrerythrin [Planctomycetaceae bacterium]|tara:strand:+ start:1716 stop:2171 length:456 start_codon:yes stop_codon:yes gene_type:complete
MNDNAQIIKLLQDAYNHELEVVTNFIANSINLDGIRAEEIKKALAADIAEELTHAQQLANRIKQIGGLVPGSGKLDFGRLPQPPEDTCDVIGVIKGVIDTEIAACNLYNQIIKATDGVDYVTQDLCISLLADEEEHLVLFRGYLKEYERDS